MKCSRCRSDNRAGARFCRECGATFSSVCPACGATAEVGSKFCDGCGASLAGASPAPVERQGPVWREAERRQLTVMFCDLADSTRLSGRLDPEVLRDVIRSYQQAGGEVIGRFDGHIAQYLGDGILAYFGYPAAHEDDAQRAVRAALGLLTTMETLNARLRHELDITLSVRVGIHTGLVVVGPVGGTGREETLALGETPNVAARLQGLAAADSVVISDGTYRLVREHFVSSDLGLHSVKGMPAPMRAYRVVSEASPEVRLDASAVGATPLLGREGEVQWLLSRWDRVNEGLGQVVMLSGEAGIGKSRLVQAVKEHLAAQPHTRWECRASPYHQDSAFHPVIDLFERALAFGRGEAPHDKLASLEAALARHRPTRPDTLALWAAFLSIPLGNRPELNLTPQRQKQDTLEAIMALLLALAAERPVLFIVEDLQWVDASTLQFLDLVVDRAATARVFIMLTSRPDFQPPWSARAHVAHLTVNRMTHRHAERMVEHVAGGKHLPDEVLREVVTRTDGVPLFVEELTKTLLESGLLRAVGDLYELTGPLPPLAIPTTLRDSLMARLDRLATVKDLAQVAAALGRSFSYELLRAVTGVEEPQLKSALAALVDAELLYQRGVGADVTYVFKHALVQETAYESMLKSRRQALHQRIAEALTDRFPDIVETQPELVAQHYSEAGRAGPAVAYWLRAGQRAAARSANVEAITHLHRGLVMVAAIQDADERVERELELQTTLGPALIATRGFAAPEVELAYGRARALCQHGGEAARLVPVLWALWCFYLVRAELPTANGLAEQLRGHAEQADDPAFLVGAERALGTHHHFQGNFALAREHSARGITLWTLDRHRALPALYAEHPGVVCRCFAAHHLWYLGYPDQALAMIREAVALARQLAHPYSLVHALDFAAWLHLYRREPRLARELAEEDIEFATEQNIAFFLSHGAIFQGWALCEQGETDAGLAQILDGIAAYRNTGATLEHPFWLALHAEACWKAGRAADGVRVIDDALAEVREKGWRFCEAELHRLRGELLLQLDATAEGDAETCFRDAIEVASRQAAKSLELRAATSLCRLLAKQGKREDARRTLGPVYGWFTEGFDTADLKDAASLLDELSRGPRGIRSRS